MPDPDQTSSGTRAALLKHVKHPDASVVKHPDTSVVKLPDTSDLEAKGATAEGDSAVGEVGAVGGWGRQRSRGMHTSWHTLMRSGFL